MSNHFELLYPPRIVFGSNACTRIPELFAETMDLAEPRALVVCCRQFDTADFRDMLAVDGKINIAATLSGIPHDPPLTYVDDVIEKIRSCRANCVVAIGGGSVIDTAKAAACLAPIPNVKAIDYFLGRKTICSRGLPFIAAPTTAGTGAEITKNSVLTDTDIKQSIRSPYMTPAVAVIDPNLTLSCSPELTAGSGLDALTQAIESFLSSRANAVTRALAQDAVYRLLEHLPQAFHSGRDLGARTQVAKGSLLSAMAFSQSGLGAVHGLAHPLGALLKIPHGLVCAILLPHVLQWNLPVCRKHYEALGKAVGKPEPEAFVKTVEQTCEELGVPRDFAAYGLCEEHFPHVVANCRSNSMKTTPGPMSDAEVLELLARLR